MANPMTKYPIISYIVRHIAHAILILFLIGTTVFFLSQLTPGDPAVAILGGIGSHPTQQAIAAVRESYGLNHPLIQQYGDYLWGVIHGNFGISYSLKEPVSNVIKEQIGSTLILTFTALVFSWILSIISVLFTAGKSGLGSKIVHGVEIISAALPQFWLGGVLLLVFTVKLHWFPVVDDGSIWAVILPALALAIPLAGFLGQVTRDEYINQLQQPYVVSARARGTRDIAIYAKQVLRHAALPGINLSAWGLGSLISGAVLVEEIFARQGIGQILVSAALSQDIPLVIGVTYVVAVVYIVANFITDLVSIWVDPRLKVSLSHEDKA